jgi:hypothetical protein
LEPIDVDRLERQEDAAYAQARIGQMANNLEVERRSASELAIKQAEKADREGKKVADLNEQKHRREREDAYREEARRADQLRKDRIQQQRAERRILAKEEVAETRELSGKRQALARAQKEARRRDRETAREERRAAKEEDEARRLERQAEEDRDRCAQADDDAAAVVAAALAADGAAQTLPAAAMTRHTSSAAAAAKTAAAANLSTATTSAAAEAEKWDGDEDVEGPRRLGTQPHSQSQSHSRADEQQRRRTAKVAEEGLRRSDQAAWEELARLDKTRAEDRARADNAVKGERKRAEREAREAKTRAAFAAKEERREVQALAKRVAGAASEEERVLLRRKASEMAAGRAAKEAVEAAAEDQTRRGGKHARADKEVADEQRRLAKAAEDTRRRAEKSAGRERTQARREAAEAATRAERTAGEARAQAAKAAAAAAVPASHKGEEDERRRAIRAAEAEGAQRLWVKQGEDLQRQVEKEAEKQAALERARREKAEKEAEKEARRREQKRREEEDKRRRRGERKITNSNAAPTADSGDGDATRGINPRTTVALIPGHWIDPGEEVGAPGERALNLVITNRAHRLLGGKGWTVLRPDLAQPPLEWSQYLAWIREQSRAGVAVLEVHGQGAGAVVEGRVTGVIAQDGAALGSALANTFGRFPMDWRDLAVPRCGGAVVESFDATALEELSPSSRSSAVDSIARDIAEAVADISQRPKPNDGCSASGCLRW